MKKEFLEFRKDSFFKFSLIVFAIFGFLSLCVMPLLLKIPAFHDFFDLTKGKDVGEALNGLASPFIALFASLLTFLAFYVQFKANVQQRNQFQITLKIQKKDQEEQERIWRREQFEDRFFELLKLHKENVNEIQLDDKVNGREAFYVMFQRLKELYNLSGEIWENTKNASGHHKFGKRDDLLVTKICYFLFFYGINGEEYKNFILYLKGDYKQLNYYLRGLFFNDEKLIHAKDGHSRWLAHYYRHLFITAKFVIEQNDLFINKAQEEAEKKRYIKILRAQLSNYEQLLLYYNAVLWYPDEWRELFVKYKLIKNVPFSLALLEPKPMDYFLNEIKEFSMKGEVLFEAQEKIEKKMYFTISKSDKK